MLSGVAPCFVPKALEAIAVSRSGYGPPAFAHSVTLDHAPRWSHLAAQLVLGSITEIILQTNRHGMQGQGYEVVEVTE